MSVSEEGPQVGPDILVEEVLGVVGVCWRGSKWRRMFINADVRLESFASFFWSREERFVCAGWP